MLVYFILFLLFFSEWWRFRYDQFNKLGLKCDLSDFFEYKIRVTWPTESRGQNHRAILELKPWGKCRQLPGYWYLSGFSSVQCPILQSSRWTEEVYFFPNIHKLQLQESSQLRNIFIIFKTLYFGIRLQLPLYKPWGKQKWGIAKSQFWIFVTSVRFLHNNINTIYWCNLINDSTVALVESTIVIYWICCCYGCYFDNAFLYIHKINSSFLLYSYAFSSSECSETDVLIVKKKKKFSFLLKKNDTLCPITFYSFDSVPIFFF